jgi:hypothetical protein
LTRPRRISSFMMDAASNYQYGVRAICALKFPLCPMGDSCLFCSLFAGWRCRCWGRHSDHLIVHHQWEHSSLCACSCSQVPIAPMGDSRFARCLQGGGVAVLGGTVTISSCTISGTAYSVRAHPQKFPMPQWETHVLLVFCRVVVFLSMEAQCQS